MKAEYPLVLVIIAIISFLLYFSGAYSHFKFEQLPLSTVIPKYSNLSRCDHYISDISDGDIDVNSSDHNTRDDIFYSININLSHTDNPQAVSS